MTNMAYCRFENTAAALQECADHMCDDNLSMSEIEARDRLIATCRELIIDWDDR
jgi:hypothetical protein